MDGFVFGVGGAMTGGFGCGFGVGEAMAGVFGCGFGVGAVTSGFGCGFGVGAVTGGVGCGFDGVLGGLGLGGEEPPAHLSLLQSTGRLTTG